MVDPFLPLRNLQKRQTLITKSRPATPAPRVFQLFLRTIALPATRRLWCRFRPTEDGVRERKIHSLLVYLLRADWLLISFIWCKWRWRMRFMRHSGYDFVMSKGMVFVMTLERSFGSQRTTETWGSSVLVRLFAPTRMVYEISTSDNSLLRRHLS